MIPTIYDDALARPTLFLWFGAAQPQMDDRLRSLPFSAHPELLSFWRRTGGGEIFESETILGPLAEDEADNLLKVNELHWSKGLPSDRLIFHTGTTISASFADTRRQRNLLVSFKRDSYEIQESFETFSEWYREVPRKEFAKRYGLASWKFR